MNIWNQFRNLDPNTVHAVAKPVRRPAPKASTASARSAEHRRLVAEDRRSNQIAWDAHQAAEITANTEAVRAMASRQRLAECIHASTR